ncbi:cytochrome c biogenesis CcdA family protein [Prochlorococcus sp. MIT 0603]|uniref:cytochrome c biogenesis CcdA family protein n=1 Tax=unclassified Prochlorococcus TaxID=2627481 RepID=UPI000533902B|nr:cytochrome c biogenesis protein CcdA [Prochlorococcus sp. MIT 0603]KGG14780.1 Cytochrome c-type bioproteinsis protein CcdA (DsbD-like) [Prochlorococcus sp. MIT 0602]KGG15786.1 Cytochrome c-type bioproteinsis protein CcdA (DsbD-like) [Prochlorococcus sp. MIT 0603]
MESPGPLTLAIVFIAGVLTSLGPCSLSLLPVTVAYLSGFNETQNPFIKSLLFCSGIVSSLVILGSLSGLFGKIYGQLPSEVTIIVPLIMVLMGLNLLGILKFRLPNGPDFVGLQEKSPNSLAPIAAGLTFGLASSPCTTPILAVILAWIAQSGNPLIGVVILACFGFGQVITLFIAGTTAAAIPKLLEMKRFSKWVPALSGAIFLITGLLSLFAQWI